MNTSPRFSVRGNAIDMASSPTSDAEVQQRMSLVEWINSSVPPFNLSVKASVEELRASLIDGVILSHILQKLKYNSTEKGGNSNPSTPSRRNKVQRFIAATSEMGLPSFEITDLEKGSMRPVLDCLLALKEHTKGQFGSLIFKNVDDRRQTMSELKFQRSYRPLSPESPTLLLHGGTKLREVFQMKQGFYADIPGAKISEMIKSNSLDIAPTQSLLSMVNGILDESIERKNAEIPQRVACLLRKVVQEIERRVATQGEHLRTQSNLFKAREEKYQSRIQVLEALAKGTSEESEIVMSQLQHLKKEMVDKKRFEQLVMEEKKSIKHREMEEKKRFEQIMEEKKRFEEQEADKLKEMRKKTNIEVSKLKQELETAKITHDLRIQNLETQAKQLKSDLENKLRQQEKLLEDSKVKMKELELNSQSKSLNWIKKEHIYEKLVNLHISGLNELRLSSESIKQEMLTMQNTYMHELNLVGAKLTTLSKAAQSYHDVLNENRKLYNELQDLKGNIRVFCRVRPFLPGENKKQSILEDVGEHGELTISNPAKPKDSPKSFRFNKVYGPIATQAEVFADTQPLIRTILDGYNVCIFAYGQTGSGKTYTMSGPDNVSKDDWGVNYRALDDLFQLTEDRKDFFLYEIGVQMIEIYNDQIRELLSSDGSQKKLAILTTPQTHGLAVPDASMLPVRSTEDVIELMNIGLANRSVSATAMNEISSRSHSVVIIHVQGTDVKSGATTHGCLHLVDLAGSERVDRSEVTGDRLKEAQYINKSLSSLGDVIFALAKKSPHVPYRNSKLTQVLQASLGGRAKTLMFVQMNPDVSSYTETLSTLKFAERVSGVELGGARNNKEGRDVKELIDQVASLKDLMAKKDSEIDQLLKDPRNPNISKKSINSLMTGSLSPNSNPFKGGVRRPGILHKSFDSMSDHYNPIAQYTSEVSENDGIRPSRSMSDLKDQKSFPGRQSKRAGGISMDDDMMGMGGGNSDDRLSETSESDLSVGTNPDSTLEENISSERPNSSDSSEKRRERLKAPMRLPHSQRTPTGASRLSQVKTTLRKPSALKNPGNSFSVTPRSDRRWT